MRRGEPQAVVSVTQGVNTVTLLDPAWAISHVKQKFAPLIVFFFLAFLWTVSTLPILGIQCLVPMPDTAITDSQNCQAQKKPSRSEELITSLLRKILPFAQAASKL